MSIYFSSKMTNFPETFLKMTNLRSIVTKNTRLGIYHWNHLFDSLITPFVKEVKTKQNMNGCFKCQIIGNHPLPHVRHTNLIREDMRKILGIHKREPRSRYKKPVLVFYRTNVYDKASFDECNINYECHISATPRILTRANVVVVDSVHLIDTFAVRPTCKIVEIVPTSQNNKRSCSIDSYYLVRYRYNLFLYFDEWLE